MSTVTFLQNKIGTFTSERATVLFQNNRVQLQFLPQQQNQSLQTTPPATMSGMAFFLLPGTFLFHQDVSPIGNRLPCNKHFLRQFFLRHF